MNESSGLHAFVSELKAVVNNETNVLKASFPSVQKTVYKRCPRVNDFCLPPKDDRNFISRVLYYGPDKH